LINTSVHDTGKVRCPVCFCDRIPFDRKLFWVGGVFNFVLSSELVWKTGYKRRSIHFYVIKLDSLKSLTESLPGNMCL
jgi:hypothetical protein